MLLSFVLYILYESDIVFLKNLLSCFGNLCMSFTLILVFAWDAQELGSLDGVANIYNTVPRLGGVGVSKEALCLKDWLKLHLCLLLALDGMVGTKFIFSLSSLVSKKVLLGTTAVNREVRLKGQHWGLDGIGWMVGLLEVIIFHFCILYFLSSP